MYFDVKGKKYKGLRLRFVLTVEEKKSSERRRKNANIDFQRKRNLPCGHVFIQLRLS